MLGYQLWGTVRQQLILLDHNIALTPDTPEVAEFDPAEIALEDEDVVQLDVEVAEALAVDPLQGRPDLPRHPLRAKLPDPVVRDVGGQVPQRRVLRREHVVAISLYVRPKVGEQNEHN